ncbi:MAG: molybdenum cofactor biosynthesis protein MoaE [Hyphomonadaceae bacterium]
MILVRITTSPLDVCAELAALEPENADAGAIASFAGYCRAATGGRAVTRLELEHYPGFSERGIRALAERITARTGVSGLVVTHRVGTILPGAAIVVVGARSAHRTAALTAVSDMMDYLKTDAPIWKREIGPDGPRWIEPRQEDRQRRAALDAEDKLT